MKRKCISSEEATPAVSQHTTPCTDCPFARDALAGWLGALSPSQWLAVAAGEGFAECHVHSGAQCAGLAIFRRNIAKLPRNPAALRLEADRARVFSTPAEFLAHHRLARGAECGRCGWEGTHADLIQDGSHPCGRDQCPECGHENCISCCLPKRS